MIHLSCRNTTFLHVCDVTFFRSTLSLTLCTHHNRKPLQGLPVLNWAGQYSFSESKVMVSFLIIAKFQTLSFSLLHAYGPSQIVVKLSETGVKLNCYPLTFITHFSDLDNIRCDVEKLMIQWHDTFSVLLKFWDLSTNCPFHTQIRNNKAQRQLWEINKKSVHQNFHWATGCPLENPQSWPGRAEATAYRSRLSTGRLKGSDGKQPRNGSDISAEEDVVWWRGYDYSPVSIKYKAAILKCHKRKM